MADSVVQVDLSDQAADFRRLALQPGMGLLDKAGAHAAILRKWLGSYLAMPAWEGQVVNYQIRTEDNQVFQPKNMQMLTAAECKGAFRAELEIVAQKLEAAPARTGTERALRHVMLERLKKLMADPGAAARTGVFAKYLDPSGIWRLVWLWGFERKSSDAGTPVICKKPDCRTLAVITEDRRVCPKCKTKLSVPRSPLPMLAAVLALILVGGGIAFWLTRPPAEIPTQLAELNGQVLSSAGQRPVAGATVRIEGGDAETTTDSEGKFQLDLPDELVTLLVTSPGFLDARREIDPQKQGGNLLNISLRGAATFQGVVKDKISQAPISGAAVSLPEWGVTAETNGEGVFVIENAPARKLQLQVEAEGYQAKKLEETLAAKQEPPLEIQLAGGGKLVGTVTDALTLAPVPEATVYLMNTPLTTKTDEAGRFEIDGIPTGMATIAVQAEGYQTESSDHELKGTEIRPFLAGVHGAGIVRGRVLSQADGEPLAGAEIEITHPKFQRTIKANARGEFEFQKLPPGEVEVKTKVPGFQEAAQTVAVRLDLEPVEFLLAGNSSLKGTVIDAALKKPIPGAEVRIAGTNLSTTTAEDGSYQLSNIPGRMASVEVVAQGYRQENINSDFAARRDSTLDVALTGGTILSGIVRDALSETPIPGAEIELAGSMQKVKTDEEGRFRFEELPAGSKTLKVAATGYLPAEETADLKAEEESHLKINLKGDAEIQGRVVSAIGERPLEGVTVQLAGTKRETKTNAKGEFHFENVPSGFWELQASRAGYLPGRANSKAEPAAETRVEIGLTGAASLVGTVTDTKGVPLGHAVVQIKESEIESSTESDGKFQVEGLLPGQASATFSAKGFHPEERNVDLSLDEPTPVGNIPLKPIEADADVVAKAFEIPAPDGAIVVEGGTVVERGVIIPRADFQTRLERAGAKTGDVQVSLAWDNINDIDLHVQAPSGEVIYFRNRHSECGGELDVDQNAGGARSEEPIENIYWPLNTAPKGKYKVLAHHYANHGAADPTRFRVAVKNGTEVKYYTGQLDPNQKLLVCEFERLAGPGSIAIGPGGPGTAVVENSGEDPAEGAGSADGEGDGKAPKKPPVYNRTDEENAAERLRLAQDLLALKKTDAAKSWLQDVVRQYPNTRACKKCQGLLDELAKSGEGDTDVGDGIYLADLTPVKKNVGGTLQPRNALIGGEKRHHSLWTRTTIPNPPASVEYALGRRYSMLSGSVGIDESGTADRTRVSTTFRIVGDSKVLWTSQSLRTPGQSQRFEVDVSEVGSLRILTDSNRIPSHYAIWVDPWLAGYGSKK